MNTANQNHQPTYQRGTGHVLAAGHNPQTCTACAYEAGRRDGRDEEKRARQSSALDEMVRIGEEAGLYDD